MTSTPSPISSRRRVFYGTAVHSKSLDEIEYLHQALIGTDAHGVIAFVEANVEPEGVADRLGALGCSDAPLTRLRKGEFLLPGYVSGTINLMGV